MKNDSFMTFVVHACLCLSVYLSYPQCGLLYMTNDNLSSLCAGVASFVCLHVQVCKFMLDNLVFCMSVMLGGFSLQIFFKVLVSTVTSMVTSRTPEGATLLGRHSAATCQSLFTYKTLKKAKKQKNVCCCGPSCILLLRAWRPQ